MFGSVTPVVVVFVTVTSNAFFLHVKLFHIQNLKITN